MKNIFSITAAKKYEYLIDSPVVFFSSEYAVDAKLPTYAGGLGVLTGDFIMEAADEGLPFILVSLSYGEDKDRVNTGYVLLKDSNDKVLTVEVPIENKVITARAWKKTVGSTVTILLDTNVPENSAEDRQMCTHLYDPKFYVRFHQQIIMGVGGIQFLKLLGVTPHVYHLNEGHTGFAALGIIGTKMDEGMSFDNAVIWTKEHVVSSKHTVFSESGLHVRSGELISHIKSYCEKHGIDVNKIFSIGIHELDSDTFSTTGFMVNLSRKSNGVSIIHTIFEKDVHKKSILIPITNGVYKPRWKSKLWTAGSTNLSDTDVWSIKGKLRAELLEHVKKDTGVSMNPDACTIVWARRFAAYKRPSLLFSDIARLGRICSVAKEPVQFIISGKAHESDQEGQKLVSLIRGLTEDPVFKGKIVYMPDYSIETAALLVAGADVWLNTPIRGKEASGTSGMKAGLNGTLQVSISDGWMDEVDWKGTGWILPDEGTGEALYSMLESEIVPLFSDRPKNSIPEEWIRRMRATMNIVETRFGAERMLRDYLRQLYEIQ